MDDGKRRTWVAAAVVVCLLGALTVQVIVAIRGQSLTWDEGDHVFSGVEIWRAHDYSYNPEHPPMVKMLGALPLVALPLHVPVPQKRFFKDEAYYDGQQLLFRNAPFPAQMLIFRMRAVEIVFSLAAALLVFAAATEMFSLGAGLCALLLFCFEPTLLAHSAYVTTDMAASCTIFATIYALWRWSVKPTLPRLAVTGAAAGLALAAKHSTVLLAPMLVLLLGTEVVRVWWTQRKASGNDVASKRVRDVAGRCAFAGVAITLIAVAVLWSFYGFRYNARPAGLVLTPSLVEYVAPLAPHEAHALLWLGRFHLLPEAYLYGLADVRSMANGMSSFFYGHVYAHGVWFYFPTVFAMKTTLGMLALLALAVFAMAKGWMGERRAIWFLLLPPALYFAVAMDSHLNIGARHILPVFVFCCVLAGAAAAALMQRGRVWSFVAVALLAAHVVSSLCAYPNDIAYANEAWGGPAKTYRYLSDSNTDWGQQLVATSAYLREHHITHCWFAYFVAPFVDPADYGIPCRPLPTPDTMFTSVAYDVPPVIDGTVLISAGDLNSFETGSSVLNPYESFMTKQPMARIQDGISVFEGTFAVPLASALGHVVLANTALKAGNSAEGLRHAQIAQATAPGEVRTEMVLGDALVAVHRPAEARVAYGRARQRVEAMDADERAVWFQTLDEKLKAAQ